jgi:hypothetical protein
MNYTDLTKTNIPNEICLEYFLGHKINIDIISVISQYLNENLFHELAINYIKNICKKYNIRYNQYSKRYDEIEIYDRYIEIIENNYVSLKDLKDTNKNYNVPWFIKKSFECYKKILE